MWQTIMRSGDLHRLNKDICSPFSNDAKCNKEVKKKRAREYINWNSKIKPAEASVQRNQCITNIFSCYAIRSHSVEIVLA